MGLLMTAFLAAGTLTARADPSPFPPGGTYFDDDGNVFEGAIEAISDDGITVGCTESYYCPDPPVTRYEMATFLTRATGITPADPIGFTDVTGVHAASVGAIEAAGWAKGCNPPDNDEFCGERAMNRGEMAAMLVRAFGLDATTTDRFVDDEGSIFEAAIDALADAGITKGCDPPYNIRYCPDEAVSRAQMAGFLARALHLQTRSPPDPFDGRMVLGSPGASFGLVQLATLDDVRVPSVVLSEWVWQPTMSPDTRTIAYVDLLRLCPEGNPKSPDCRRRLFTMPFAGGVERPLTPDWLDVGASFDHAFSWSADGATIWFSASEDEATSLWSVDVRTASLRRIITMSGDLGVVWSAQGTAAVVTEDRQTVTVIDANGAEVSTFSHPDARLDLVRWSADGKRLAYHSDRTRGGADGTGESSIVAADPSAGMEILVTRAGYVTNMAWSPDGTSLAYLELDESTTETTLHIVDADGGEPEMIVDLAGGAPGTLAWSPDGKGIALVWDVNGVEDPLLRQVWVARIADGEMWPLTPPDPLAFTFEWR